MSFKNKARMAFNALHFPFGKTIKGVDMKGKTVVLDFSRMEGCTLTNCTVVFFGVGGFVANHCVFKECQFVFEGPAATSLEFLTTVLRADPKMARETFPFMRDQVIDQLQKEMIGKLKEPGVSK